MGKHRSRLQILANILTVVNDNGGAKKTQIMYQAYLSYSLLLRYLRIVTKAGLIRIENENFYTLTLKGEDFLIKYKKYQASRKNVDNQRSILDVMYSNINEENVENNDYV